jgi:hypothetical protein
VALILLAHLGIPLVFGLGFLVLAYVTGPEDALGSELVVEAALDLAILSIGATAAILENPKLHNLFHDSDDVIVFGMALAAVNFFLTVIVIALRRLVYRKSVTNGRKRFFAFVAIICGAATIFCISIPVVYAFSRPELSSSKLTRKSNELGDVHAPRNTF